MGHLQQLELLDQLEQTAGELQRHIHALEDDAQAQAAVPFADRFVVLVQELRAQIVGSEHAVRKHRRSVLWARCWTTQTPPGPPPVWMRADDDVEVVTLHSGDPDNLDRLCSNLVRAAEEVLQEQGPEITAVRVRGAAKHTRHAGSGAPSAFGLYR
jgi:hypothetical protein